MNWILQNKHLLLIVALLVLWMIASQRHAERQAAFEECRVQYLDYHHDQAKYSICLERAGVDHHGTPIR
jgi:hypothetical protein